MFFQATSLLCLLCLCTSGTFRLSLFLLPLLGRIRFMMFVTIFSLLITCIFLFLDVTHLIYLFPFNWGKIVSTNIGTKRTCLIFILFYQFMYLCLTECYSVRKHQRAVFDVFFVDHTSSLRFWRIFLMGTERNANSVIHYGSKLKFCMYEYYKTFVDIPVIHVSVLRFLAISVL